MIYILCRYKSIYTFRLISSFYWGLILIKNIYVPTLWNNYLYSIWSIVLLHLILLVLFLWSIRITLIKIHDAHFFLHRGFRSPLRFVKVNLLGLAIKYLFYKNIRIQMGIPNISLSSYQKLSNSFHPYYLSNMRPQRYNCSIWDNIFGRINKISILLSKIYLPIYSCHRFIDKKNYNIYCAVSGYDCVK